MPARTKADHAAILETYREIQNAREVARQLGLHYNTVNQVVRRNRGTCPRCAKQIAPGKQQCRGCTEQARIRMRTKRFEARRAGLCVECNRPRDPISKLYCADHRLKAAERVHQTKERRRGAPNQGVRTKMDRESSLRYKYGAAGVEAWNRDQGACCMCGAIYAERSIQIHHIDEDQTNNTMGNFACLCFACHRLIHSLLDHRNLNRAFAWIRVTYPSLTMPDPEQAVIPRG